MYGKKTSESSLYIVKGSNLKTEKHKSYSYSFLDGDYIATLLIAVAFSDLIIMNMLPVIAGTQGS